MRNWRKRQPQYVTGNSEVKSVVKKHYPLEDAINNVSKKFGLGLKDANEMDEDELSNAEKYVLKYVKFVPHPDYGQLVPRALETGEFIL